MQITLKVYRFNPQTSPQPHYDTFQIEAEPTERLLDCLNRIRSNVDSSLSFRMSCAHGVCGSDGLTINGQPALACQKLIKDYDYSKEIMIEPLLGFKVVKDLIVDFEPFFERIKSVNPQSVEVAPFVQPEKERIQTIEEHSNYADSLKCVLCGCCFSACPVATVEDPDFVGPAASLRSQRYLFDSRTTDRKERLELAAKPHGVTACKGYYKCTLVCPKKIKVTQAILKTKKQITQEQQQREQ
ncbi:MAG: succinate dehydrogenase iron-sulfur subunit [Candidatus Bathyarchaeota archaeon]|nr:succinate dehydrogenase iron-sulfur subunit [Candidatus Bathyarchaeota archaeon]